MMQIVTQEDQAKRQLTRELELLKQDTRILQANKELLQSYVEKKQASGVTAVTALKLVRHGRPTLAMADKPLTTYQDQDLVRHVGKIESHPTWGEWTKISRKKILKPLMRSIGWKDEQLNFIRMARPPNELTSEQLLTDDELKRMVQAAQSIMWRALIAVLCDTGIRPGELLSMKLADVHRNHDKYKIYVAGKLRRKQGKRVCYVTKGMAQLDTWLAAHPNKSPDSYVWVLPNGKNITATGLGYAYTTISNRAGITKKNWPYLIRHTRLTQFYRDFTPPVAAKLAGHVVGSREAATYVHLSDEDAERAIDEANGTIEVVKKPNTQECHNCGLVNGYDALLCIKCEKPLNAAGFLKIEQDNEPLVQVALEIVSALRDLKGKNLRESEIADGFAKLLKNV